MSEHSAIYHAPFIDIDSIDDYVPSLRREIIRVPIADGMLFQFLQNLSGGDKDVLMSTFHGARDPSRVKLPYFIRSTSLQKSNRPHILFSDPTMSINGHDLRLCWYSGTERVDLADLVNLVVGRATEFAKSRAVQFEGSSGGGFMALRMAHLAPFRSGALAISPQINAFDYENSRFADRTIAAAYPDAELDQIKLKKSDRFNLTQLLSRRTETNSPPFIRYVQNEADQEHVKLQLRPFLDAKGISYEPRYRRFHKQRTDVLIQRHGDGHIAPPAGVWDAQSDILRARILRDLRDETDIVSDTRISTSSLPLEDGEYLVENSDGSPAVHYRVQCINSSGSYIRVFFQSAAFRTEHDAGVAFRRPVTRDANSIADISVSDPTLRLDPNLTAGWYLGNGCNPAYTVIARHIRDLIATSGIQRAVFIGQSVGGYGALQVAALVDNSYAFVFNPTLSLGTIDRGPSRRLMVATGVSADVLDGVGQAFSPFDISSTVQNIPFYRSMQAIVHVGGADEQYLKTQAPFLRVILALREDWLRVAETSSGIPSHSEQEEFVAEECMGLFNEGLVGASFTGRELPPVNFSEIEPERIRIAVYGGCVTRDTAASVVSKWGGGEVVSYVARQSLISVGNPVPEAVVDVGSLTSRWQARRLLSDLEGGAIDEISAVGDQVDLLLFDFLMERHGVFQVDTGYVTRSYELGLAGGLNPEGRHLKFGSVDHWDLWTGALVKFRDFLISSELWDRTVLFAVPWASRSVTGGDSGNSEGMTATVANALFPPYYEFARKLGFAILTMPEGSIAADGDNKWGLAPYHYSREVYDRLSDAIIGLTTGRNV